MDKRTDRTPEPRADLGPWGELNAYLVDAAQRQILFWDVVRRRGDQFLEHREAGKPPVLHFDYRMLIDGRSLDRPCNYALLEILPDPSVARDPAARPFVIVDPRAGHGPGIGGFKQDSQVGVALGAGHPVYFVTFFPEPVAGQTLGDIALAEAHFIQSVAERHPEADGKPCVVGNCQAGWAIAGLAATAPDLMGPILLNGAPLSYWAGVDGKNPMRYAGGLLGGKWLASLASDLGDGRFDGAHLVANFENLNPANTLWSKAYGLYANVDTEAERFLEFERWWGGFFLMNAEEIDRIVSELFIGNKLASARIETADGEAIDLRNIRSPIVVFASWGDNITPPQQALNWIVDLYGDESEIVANDQTIVYLLHEDIGHLGIFVSGKVARTEHAEIFRTLDLIESLPPGLYEMVVEPKTAGMPHADLLPGDFTVRFEHRTVADIRALDDAQRDEDYFSSLDAISGINDAFYRAFASPWIRGAVNEWTAEATRQMHPQRFGRFAFGSANPFMWAVPWLADSVRSQRQRVGPDNPFAAAERETDSKIVAALDRYRDVRDGISRELFKALYGPNGLGAIFAPRSPAAGDDPDRAAALEGRKAALLSRIGEGGFTEAVVRIVLAAASDRGAIERRSAVLAREIWDRHPRLAQIDRPARWKLVREQGAMLYLDEDAALAAIPGMLPTAAEREEAKAIVIEVLMAAPDGAGETGPAVAKLRRIFGDAAPPAAAGDTDTAAGEAGVTAPAARRKVAAARPARTSKRAAESAAGARPATGKKRAAESAAGARPATGKKRAAESAAGARPATAKKRAAEGAAGARPATAKKRAAEGVAGARPATGKKRAAESAAGARPATAKKRAAESAAGAMPATAKKRPPARRKPGASGPKVPTDG